MTSAGEIERVLQDVLANSAPDAIAAYLFGSCARGEMRKQSDVDVGVLFTQSPATLEGRFGMESALEARLQRTVQLIVLNDAPPDLVHRVLRDGKLVLDRDRRARIRFEVAARNAYFDVRPLLERYRRPRPHAP